MLEVLLRQYEDQFGVPFPLMDFAEHPEIEVINILYDCVQEGKPYEDGMKPHGNRFGTDAPGAR
jgi:hypothetical protein